MSKPKNPTKIKMVKKGNSLTLPSAAGGGRRVTVDGDQFPYFVDVSDPIEAILCAGQEFKLEDAPAGSKATELSFALSKHVARMRGEAEPVPPKTVATKMQENAEAAPAPVQGDLPGVSARPKPKAKDEKPKGGD